MKRKQLFGLNPLFTILLPLTLIVLLIPLIYNEILKIKAKQFHKKNQNKYLFFYNNSRGWGDFIANNVLPILPGDTIVYNTLEDKNIPILKMNTLFKIYKIPEAKTKLPYIVKLCYPIPKTLTFQTNYSLAKKTPKRDKKIQVEIENEITNELNCH